MIDFTDYPINIFKTYGGANGSKIAVKIDDEQYMLKFSPVRKQSKNESFSNSSLSEYISCHIINSLGLKAQDTLLGYYHDREVVACRDFETDGYIFRDFGSLKNTIIHSAQSGYGVELTDILTAISQQKLISPTKLKEFFWEMFIADALLGNFDRHNGNWGFLINEEKAHAKIAPIFDCGSCLYPQNNEQGMKEILKSKADINNRIYVFPQSIIKINDKKINYFDYISSLENEDCNKALLTIYPRIDMNFISSLINGLEISDIKKEFYLTMLTARKERILEYSFKKLKTKVYEKDKFSVDRER